MLVLVLQPPFYKADFFKIGIWFFVPCLQRQMWLRQVLMLCFEQQDRLIATNKFIYTESTKTEKGDCKLKEINNK